MQKVYLDGHKTEISFEGPVHKHWCQNMLDWEVIDPIPGVFLKLC